MRILLLLFLALGASAGVFEHEAGGVLIWFPDDWNVDIEDNRLAAAPAGGDARAELVSLPGAADLDAAREAVRALLARRLRQWRETEPPREVSLGGMPGIRIAGDGVEGGVRRILLAVVFKAPRQCLLLTWSADPARAPQLAGTWDRIFSSVKPGRNPR